MATEKQIAANRRNAEKSTGPRTAAGKAASSANSLKLGIYAKSLLIPGEDPAALDALRDELYTHFAPANSDERNLLDLMITNEWMLRRLHACHTQMWTRGIELYSDPDSATPLTGPFNRYEDHLAKLQRMINAADRSFHRARTALIKAQAARQRAKTDPQPADPKPETAKLASFRQKTPRLVMTPANPELAALPDPGVQRSTAP